MGGCGHAFLKTSAHTNYPAKFLNPLQHLGYQNTNYPAKSLNPLQHVGYWKIKSQKLNYLLLLVTVVWCVACLSLGKGNRENAPVSLVFDQSVQ